MTILQYWLVLVEQEQRPKWTESQSGTPFQLRQLFSDLNDQHVHVASLWLNPCPYKDDLYSPCIYPMSFLIYLLAKHVLLSYISKSPLKGNQGKGKLQPSWQHKQTGVPHRKMAAPNLCSLIHTTNLFNSNNKGRNFCEDLLTKAAYICLTVTQATRALWKSYSKASGKGIRCGTAFIWRVIHTGQSNIK